MAIDWEQILSDVADKPLVTEGDEGKIRERSLSEIMEARRDEDRRAASKSPLHGMRASVVRPRGTV